jgi:hypothetical protein
MPVFDRIPERIRNGRSVGINVLSHRVSPSRAASVASFGKKSRKHRSRRTPKLQARRLDTVFFKAGNFVIIVEKSLRRQALLLIYEEVERKYEGKFRRFL